jgi:hypothetical protein
MFSPSRFVLSSINAESGYKTLQANRLDLAVPDVKIRK